MTVIAGILAAAGLLAAGAPSPTPTATTPTGSNLTPSGAPQTGGGSERGGDTGMLVAGFVLLGAAAVAGTVALRVRRNGNGA